MNKKWRKARMKSGLARFERDCACGMFGSRRTKLHRVPGTAEAGRYTMLLAETNRIYKEITTSSYWDCECDKHYIHPSTHGNIGKCKICGAQEKDQPNSFVNEINPENMAVRQEDL